MNAPIPRDIPLPLPASEGLLEILLIVSFVVHIIFVHLMVGGSLFSLVCQIKGLDIADYDRLANYIMRSITVNKSLAVVMGVAPLLIINTLYAPQFYASSALMGDVWMAVIPLVTIAFLAAYAHKFWWNRFVDFKVMHIGIAFLETAIFLLVPLIFMTNVNLMLFPERWPEVKGFFSAMLLPNVLPRYLHFLSAAVLISSLFLVWLTGRRAFAVEAPVNTLRILDVRRFFYSFALGAVLVQVLTGMLAWITLPAEGMSWTVTIWLFIGGVPAIPAVWLIWRDLNEQARNAFKHFNKVVGLFAISILIMAYARHEYRVNSLTDHNMAIALKTANYRAAALQAKQDADYIERMKPEVSQSGEGDFQQYCAACHHSELPTVGPAIPEIKTIYANDLEGFVRWTRSPGKKRPESMKMPGFSHLSDNQLQAIARYVLAREE